VPFNFRWKNTARPPLSLVQLPKLRIHWLSIDVGIVFEIQKVIYYYLKS